jgi:alkylation response protein AidB-like acyl-CoA dehydrogenase
MDFGLSPAQRRLQETARQLAQGEFAGRAAAIDRSEEYPWDNVRLLKEAGFFGMTIPTEYGGRGLTYFDAVLVIEQIAQACGVTARIVVEANMGAVGAIMEYGSPAQKRLAADLVLAGDKPAICITEPEAGSAASDMTTRADRRGDRFVINGGKHWITGGGVSRLHLVFARVFDQNGEEEGIGGFIAVRDETKGLRIGKREPAMGLRGIPETEIIFEDMVLPASALLVSPRGLAKGFADLMNAYNGQRIGAATVALGIAEGAYELALAHSQLREQFGRPISEFQGLQWMLADMATQIAAAQALIYKAATRGGSGFPDVMEAAQAKVFASEMAVAVTNDALQLHGSAGYSRNRPLERMVRDARMFTIGGGTAQILRTVIAARLLNRRLPQTRHGYLLEAGGKTDKSDGGRTAAKRRAAK